MHPIVVKLVPVYVLLFLKTMSVCATELYADTTIDSKNTSIIRIAPASALVTSDTLLFDSITYLPLETTRESEFSSITQLEVTDEHFIILDERLQTILFFNKDGTFYKKITPKDKDLTTPYKFINRFTIDSANNLMWVDDSHSPYLFEFDLRGNFIKTFERQFSTGVDFSIYNGLVFTYYGFDASSDTINIDSFSANLMVVDQKSRQLKSSYFYFDPSQINYTNLFNARNFYKSGNQLYFVRPYDYNIYLFDSSGGLHRLFSVILPIQHTLPSDFLSNSRFRNKWIQYTNENSQVVHTFSNIYKINGWLTFQIDGHDVSQSLLYGTKTGELYDLNLLESSSLPMNGVYSSILANTGDALITAIHSNSLKVKYHNSTKETQSQTPSDIMEIMDMDFHNPILVLSYL